LIGDEVALVAGANLFPAQLVVAQELFAGLSGTL
jgi:hypothetical protein